MSGVKDGTAVVTDDVDATGDGRAAVTTAAGPLAAARPGLGLGALDGKLGVMVLEASAGRVVARMPVETNTQSFGLLHGGASAALAEAVGSWAAVIHAGPRRTALGVDLSVTHHRAARDGSVTATATALHLGSTVVTYAVEVLDDAGHRLATARMTCLLRDLPAAARGGDVSGSSPPA